MHQNAQFFGGGVPLTNMILFLFDKTNMMLDFHSWDISN